MLGTKKAPPNNGQRHETTGGQHTAARGYAPLVVMVVVMVLEQVVPAPLPDDGQAGRRALRTATADPAQGAPLGGFGCERREHDTNRTPDGWRCHRTFLRCSVCWLWHLPLRSPHGECPG